VLAIGQLGEELPPLPPTRRQMKSTTRRPRRPSREKGADHHSRRHRRSQRRKQGRHLRYLNFTTSYKDSLSLVFQVAKNPKEFTIEKRNEWTGKKVRATGTVSEFGGNLQIARREMGSAQEGGGAEAGTGEVTFRCGH
jgi:hypothetical protein